MGRRALPEWLALNGMLQDKLPAIVARGVVPSFPVDLASFSDLERHEGEQ